jgi:hypothetical protein
VKKSQLGVLLCSEVFLRGLKVMTAIIGSFIFEE